MRCGFHFRFGSPSWAVALPLWLCALGCESDKKLPEQKSAREERALLDPLEKKGDYFRRCRQVPGAQPVTLRASSNEGPSGAVEVGGVAAFDAGFVVGILRATAETNAELVYLDGRGGSKVTKLGRVHGSVEPPQVALLGDDAVALVLDNDAGHTRLRLVKVTGVQKEAHVTWGPEIQVRRGETQSFSLVVGPKTAENAAPRVLLAWDDFDQSSLRSSVKGLLLDPQSMTPLGPQYQISPPKEDAIAPFVAPGREGSATFFSVWLAYEDDGEEKGQTVALVEEPSKSLRVQRLDSEGKPEGEPVRVSRAGSNVLVYDARVLSGGELVIAYREADSGRDEGGSPVKIGVVGADGSILSHSASHDELGLGAPALLEGGRSGTLWLTARTRESDVLLGLLGTSGQVEEFGLESELKERMPLAGWEGRFLVMEPDGLDLRFSTVLCSPSPDSF